VGELLDGGLVGGDGCAEQLGRVGLGPRRERLDVADLDGVGRLAGDEVAGGEADRLRLRVGVEDAAVVALEQGPQVGGRFGAPLPLRLDALTLVVDACLGDVDDTAGDAVYSSRVRSCWAILRSAQSAEATS
jgi:hypothetical protein